MMTKLLLMALCVALALGERSGSLLARERVAPAPVPAGLIVGRAVCGGTAWLLNDASLIEIEVASRRITVHDVHGPDGTEHPWGLACLTDGSLWTLSSPRVLARLDRGGRVAERIDLRLPRVALFGWGDRLLFQQLPLRPGGPALLAGVPRQVSDARLWPALLVRTASTPEEQLSANLVSCGLPSPDSVPCWFAGDRTVTVSDGVRDHVWNMPEPGSERAGTKVVIWDVALVGHERMWLLMGTSDPITGRRAGGRLIRSTRGSTVGKHIDLSPPARLILSASESSCLLLTVDGQLREVVVR